VTTPAVDVVIVSHASRELLRRCLTALLEHPPRQAIRTWVVDNGSTDGTREMVETDFPGVELIAAGRNLGFAAANNLAIRRGSAPYVLALNPDTRVTPGALDTMLALMESDRSIGIAGCRLELEDGTFDHASRRSFPTPIGALGHFTGVGRRPNAPARLAQYRAPSVQRGRVDAVNGAFMLFRRQALEEVGLFDEGYWMYMEDLDICYRFAQAGWTIWYDPGATVIHTKGGSSGPTRSPRLTFAFHYGMYRFYRKHYSSKHSRFANAVIYTGITTKLGLSLALSAIAPLAVRFRSLMGSGASQLGAAARRQD
jgi:N-acetylglucosaminyl-diphospho-decaprenol L-rhamnosyltransferase